MKIRIVDISKTPNGAQTEPITLTYAKQHCRVDFPDDDAYNTLLITQCRRAVENFCHISIVPWTITLTIRYLSDGRYLNESILPYGIPPYNSSIDSPPFELPYGPTGTVTSVSYLDDNNVVNTLDPTVFDYYVRGTDFKTIQIVRNLYFNSIVVYNTGYTTVPEDLILAILNEIAYRVDNRGDSTNRYATQQVGLSEGSQYLAAPYVRKAGQ